MTNTRSPLQELNMRRAHNAPIEELHKTLETLEKRLKEMTGEQNSNAKSEAGSVSRSKPHMNLKDIAATLDRQVTLATEKTTPPQFTAPLPKSDLSFDEELARIENSVDILTAENTEKNSDNTTLRHVRETAEHLQEELEALKRMMQTMAREESLRHLSHRWDQFDEKFDAFEQNQSHKTQAEFPELSSISDRLDDVRRAIDAMPQMQAVAIQPMEERLSSLSQAIEQMLGNKNEHTSSSVLNERLDEISRAILAGNMKRPDIEEIRRAEAVSQELLTRMAELSQRIDLLNENSSLPLQQIETLAKQIRLIATYIDRALESGPAQELEKVNTRLDKIARQLNDVETRFSMPEEALFSALDQRFDALVLRLDAQFSQPTDSHEMMHNLESQIAAIAAQLAAPQDHHPLINDLSPRLEQLESAVLQTRDDTLDIARKAAEAAMERFAAHAHQYDSGLVKELANDMRALEQLVRDNNERKEQSLESVHSTLQKVVERLTTLEERHKATTSAQPAFKGPSEAVKPLLSATKTQASAASDLPDLDITIPLTATEKPADLPDLNAIMKRVRGEPGFTSGLRQERDIKSDVIAAARSAAQSAAQEATRINAEEKISNPKNKAVKKSSFTQLIARQRKPIFLGISAIMVALAALQAGEMYFNQSLIAPQAHVSQKANSVEEVIDTKTVASTTEPARSDILTASTPVSEDKTETDPLSNSAPLSTEHSTEKVTSGLTAGNEIITDPMTLSALPEISDEAGPAALREAAAEGDAIALFEIGNRYTDGIGMQANLTKAAEFYAAAAERGLAPAQYRYGNLNEKGLGLPRNLEKAKYWYMQAAEKGNASAMHNLAVLYATGGDNAPDHKTAIQWFEKAAERDVKDSQYNLGILYAQGIGTKLDLEESYKWFALAAQSGDKDAADKRDQVGKALGQQKLKTAEGKVALWKPKTLDPVSNSVSIPDSWIDNNPVQTSSVDMKKAVRNIQLILQKNGYNIGTADGLMGEKTRNAIKQFQRANGEEPTGEVNPQLVRLLLDHNQ